MNIKFNNKNLHELPLQAVLRSLTHKYSPKTSFLGNAEINSEQERLLQSCENLCPWMNETDKADPPQKTKTKTKIKLRLFYQIFTKIKMNTLNIF